MKTSATPRTVFVAVMVAALVAGLLPAGLPEAAAAPLPSTVTLYGNASALNDIVFSEDAAWAVNYVGLIRWDREGEYQTEVPSVETPSGAPVELDPWEVRTDGVVVSNVRLTSLIVDGEGRLWSVGDQLALLDDEGRTVTSYRGDDAWWLGQHYDALVNSIYTNPRVMVVDHTTGWLWMYHPRVRVAAFDGSRLHTWRTETFRPENTLFASPEGEVWVAGPEVAYRYIKDEDSWREYHYADDMGLPSYDWGQRIFSFDSDLQGRIWVRTSAGAARFDPATETWEAFGPDQGVVGSTYADIRVDPEGNVWTLSGWNLEQNLAVLNEAEGMFVPAAPLPRYFVEPDAVQEEPSVAQVRTIRGMRMDLDGRLWILTEIGALHWNGERWQALRVAGPSMPAWSPAFAVANAPELADDPILFMGGSSKVRLADDAETWPIFSENPFSFRDVPGLSFGTVGADGKVYALRGRADLWTFNEGDVADQPENDWVPLAPARVPGNSNHPIAFSFMNDLAVDAEGTAWLASTMGLWRWRNNEWFLYEQRDGIPVHARSRLIGTVIDQLELDEDGNIWFITAPYMLQFDNYGGFLVKFDGETFETVADLPIRYLGNTGEPMRYDPVTGLIWLRDRKDLRAYDTATGAWQVADLSPLGPEVTLRDMAPTGDGGVWVVTEAGALLRYQEGAFERLTLPEANPVAGRVGVDPAGNTWVTGLSGTVSMWDGAEWTTFTAEDQLMGGRHRDLIFRDDEVFLLGQFSVDYRKGAGDWTPLRPTQPLPNAPLSPLSAMVDSEGVLWYVDRRGVARYVDGAWDIVLVFEQDLRGGGLYDIVNLPDGPLWMSNRAVLGVFDEVDWTFIRYGTTAPVLGFRSSEFWEDMALGGVDNRVFFGSSIFSFNLRMYSPDLTYWMRFPSTAELTHPVADMELAPDGRLWFGSGRAAYLDENDQMWVPPGTLEVYGQPTIRRISHGSREIFWVLGKDNFTEDENLLSRCDWMACDWVFLEPTLKIDELVATSPDDAWLNGEGFLVHVRVGEPEIEPSGGYLRIPPTPTPGPISGGPTSYGAVHDGVVIPDDPFDQWGFSANGGDIITLRLQNLTGASVLGLYLFRSDGSLVTFMTGPDEELRLTTPELFTDSYIIQVQLVDGEQANYRLHIGIP